MSGSRHERNGRDNLPTIEAMEARRLLSADLAGFFSGTAPTTLEPNHMQHVSVGMVNEGDQTAIGRVTVLLYAQNSSTDVPGVLLAEKTQNVKVMSGDAAIANLRISRPAGLAGGTYSLVADVDPGLIPDADPVNNIVTAPSKVTAPPMVADVSVSQINTPQRPIFTDGQNLIGQTAFVKIANQGNAPANGTLAIDLYLSSDKVLDGTDVLAGVVTTRPIHLQAGASKLFAAKLLPTPTLEAGDYYLFAVAKPTGITQKNAANDVGLSANRVSVATPAVLIHRHPICYEQCFSGTIVDDSGDNNNSGDIYVEIPTPSDLPPGVTTEPTTVPTTEPTTTPTTDPGSDPTTTPTTGPTTNPTTDPTTNPTTDPSGGDSSSGSGSTNTGGDTGTGGDFSGDTGGTTGGDTGSDSGDTGGDSGDDSGGDSGDDSGGDTGDDSGSDSGDDGGDTGGDSGDDSGGDFSGDSGDDSSGGDFTDSLAHRRAPIAHATPATSHVQTGVHKTAPKAISRKIK